MALAVLPPCVEHECGKDFRRSLHKPSPNYPHGDKTKKPRLVPAFTIQAMQHNTRVIPPKRSRVFDPMPAKPTLFKKCYARGEFPISILFTGSKKILRWKVPVEKLDYHHYLPVFFEGLAEENYPYTFIVQNGIADLVSKAPYKVLPVVPQLIMPIKSALDTKRVRIICNALKSIQNIVLNCSRVGEALVPYYRQILPIFNLFKDKNCNIGSHVDHTYTKRENVGDLIQETLQILERYGGPDAFINIKYIVPTYESCVQN